MAWERLRGQRWQDGRYRHGPRLRDQLTVEDVGQRALHTVVDGTPAADGAKSLECKILSQLLNLITLTTL